MSDPRHMHEYSPNAKGVCKLLLRDGPCGQSAFAEDHTRWENREPDTKLEKLRAERKRLESTYDMDSNDCRMAMIRLIEILEDE